MASGRSYSNARLSPNLRAMGAAIRSAGQPGMAPETAKSVAIPERRFPPPGRSMIRTHAGQDCYIVRRLCLFPGRAGPTRGGSPAHPRRGAAHSEAQSVAL